MRRLLTSVAIAAALAFGPATTLADPTIDAQTNAVRASYNLPPLTTSSGLASVAGTRAQQIVTNFAHPTSWQWLFDAIPGCESAIGENIAKHPAPSSGWPVSAWVASPGHLENMLRGWTHQGSAVFVSGGVTYAVQLFSRSCGSVPAPAPAPQPVPRAPIVDAIPDTSMTP